MAASKWALIFLTLFIAGCDTRPLPHRDEAVVLIRLVDGIASPAGGHAHGAARWQGGYCEVDIPRVSYPDCITHEIRHCFEGNWHAGTASTKDC